MGLTLNTIPKTLPEIHAYIVGRYTQAFPKDYPDGQHVLRLLRDARLYDVPAPIATAAYHEVQRHVYTNVIGVDFTHAGLAGLTDDDEIDGRTLTEIGLPVVMRTTDRQRKIDRVLGIIGAGKAGDVSALSVEQMRRAIQSRQATAEIPRAGGGTLTTSEVSKALIAAAEDIEFPDLPFPVVFLGSGGGLRLGRTEIEGRLRMRADPRMDVPLPDWVPVASLGFLLMRNFMSGGPAIVECVLGSDGVVEQIPHCFGDTGWISDFCYPWWFRVLLGAIKDRVYLREESGALTFGQRRRREKLRRELDVPPGGLPPPRPYYTLTLDPVAIIRASERAAPVGPYPWTHRWDVSAHERLLVRRGALPLDPRAAHALGRRGYTVYEGTPTSPPTPSPEDAFALHRKGHKAPEPGEWIALRRVKVHEHIRGPDDKPYIPALRHVDRAPETP